MNFDSAICAHSAWRLRLVNYLANPDGSINVEDLSQDNLCELGKWLHGEGKSLKDYPDYQRLMDEHANFHRAAGDIVTKKNNGENIVEQVALGSASDYGIASARVIAILMQMKKSLDAASLKN